jgi:hypothetical protein
VYLSFNHVLHVYVHDTRKNFLSCSPTKRLLRSYYHGVRNRWLVTHSYNPTYNAPQFFHCHSPSYCTGRNFSILPAGALEEISFPWPAQECMDFSTSVLLGKAWMRFSQVWMRSSLVWMRSSLVWMRSSRVGMRSSLVWMRSSL